MTCLLFLALVVAAQRTPAPPTAETPTFHFEDPAVREASGVVASRVNPGTFWTHNDSGDRPLLYPFDGQGKSLGQWQVYEAGNIDWEDIAIGPGPKRGQPYLYVADIGDNASRRRDVVVYRVEEPRITEATRHRALTFTSRATAIRLRYPDGPRNAETLLVHPRTGDLYIISKAGRSGGETTVYVARAATLGGEQPITLSILTTLALPDSLYRALAGGITGGDISPDGQRVVLCDYFRMYEAKLPAGSDFDRIWSAPFTTRVIGFPLQVEGICYAAGGHRVFAVSEGKPCVWMELPAKP